MRIEFPQSELAIALARSGDTTLRLEVGRILDGRIISSTRTTAVFETGGVRIPARTEVPLPLGAQVRLQVASITPEQVILRLAPGEAVNARPALSEPHLSAALREMGLQATSEEMAAGRALLRFGLPLDAAGVRSAARPAGMPLNDAPAARAFARYLGLPESDGVLRALDQVLSSGRRVGEMAAEAQGGAPREKGLIVEMQGGDIARALERAVRAVSQPTEQLLASGRAPDDLRTALLARSSDDTSAEATLARHLTGQQLVNSAHSQSRGPDSCVYIQIPLLVHGEHRTLEFRVERDGPGGEIDPSRMTFALRFGTKTLGEMEVTGMVFGDAVTCRFICETDAAADALNAETPRLADGLRRNDLSLTHATFEAASPSRAVRNPLCTPPTGTVARLDARG